MITAVYGSPPLALADVPAGAAQVSPLVPGSTALEALTDASLDEAVALAPPGTVERRGVIAQLLRALKPEGRLIVMAPKDKGGSRLAGDLEGLSAPFAENAKRHHRICHVRRPADLAAVSQAIAAAAPREAEGLGWTQPGVFSWDRIDAGTALLMQTLPAQSGRGADLGAGTGLLANKVLESPAVAALDLVELDRRAIDCARRNVADPRAAFHWADLRGTEPALADLDFVVMNPPFHDAGAEDRALGQVFIRRAAGALRKSGTCWLVANRHLPYEAVLGEHFARVTPHGEAGGYKVFEARK
ncbi:methyltransferase [Caulobacter sp. SLTY]|uniref:class I SAM-dependent methyltransferase n=1 Tax=Caulobacter sp. SLTY TaxID=2683262 RepID=UPI00141263E5|nr:class I SAM-dependent methyltransferase [Caulobacter sp. SLTY]NBB14342.1 methyltransferase [Caulobacter sp. SLTY]